LKRRAHVDFEATRDRRVGSEAEWAKPVVRQESVDRRMGKIAKRAVMFPTTHDITPKTLGPCMTVLRHLLEGGNRVLVVSKPHLECIKEICKKFADFRDTILFRFTIGACDNDLLRYWEPGAPTFEERLASLKHAFKHGFQTSVSIEPILDSSNVVRLFSKLEPWVTDALWIGKMNRIRNCTPVVTREDQRRIAEVEAGQTDERIGGIYAELEDRPKVKWKESIKEVVGLELSGEAGLDV
jgi:DNA repair photolyase